MGQGFGGLGSDEACSKNNSVANATEALLDSDALIQVDHRCDAVQVQAVHGGNKRFTACRDEQLIESKGLAAARVAVGPDKFNGALFHIQFMGSEPEAS